jgi:hypothetical protein
LLLSKENTEILPNGGKRRPCRDDGDGEFDRFCASVRKGDRDCNIEPPASPYAIMRRVHPYRGENSGPGKDDGAVAGLVGIECGVVSGVINLESSGVEASDWRPRHDEHYHEA